MPKTNTKAGNWDHTMRLLIRQAYGSGWSVIERHGKTRLTRTYEDKTRSSVTLDIAWEPNNATAIQNEIGVLSARMAEQKISLKDAHARSQNVKGVVTGEGVKAGAVDWQAVADAFLETRKDHRKTTLTETTRRVKNAVVLFSARTKPIDSASLLKAYASAYFERCPAGGVGRKRHLGDVCALLKFAVERCGAAGRWLPPSGDDIQELVGMSDDKDVSSDSVPIKPDQLIGLLDHLRERGKSEVWLMVALVGMYGLRPAELAALSVQDGRLYVGSQIKRNRSTMKRKPTSKLVMALEIDGRDDGALALRQFESGLVKFPKGIQQNIDRGEFKKVGNNFSNYLKKLPYWRSMVAATPGLKPYSLRHGWAWRAHKYYDRPLSVRDAAALMRHNPQTHMRHYGRWTDEQDLIDTISSLTAPKPAANGIQLI